jgi:hypothetical protein
MLFSVLQISEVVNSMKDLIDYSRETWTGPMGKLTICLLFYNTLMNGYKYGYEIVSSFIKGTNLSYLCLFATVFY